MEIRHLRYFIAVADKLHFSAAAEMLGISGATLTVQIQQIERSLQAQLFRRTKRSVALTAAGELFLQEARATLDQFERALHVGRRAGRGELGKIELGYVGSAAFSGILQQQMQQFRSRWPDVMLNARELPMDQLPQLLEDGHLDMAIARMPIKLPQSCHAHVLLRDYFCAALPAAHRLATEPLIEPGELAGETFIVPEQDLGTREVARRGDFIPEVGGAPGSLLAVLTQVSLGAGVAIVPSVLIDVVSLPDVAFMPLVGDPIISEIAAIFRRHERSPAVKKLIEQITGSALVVRDP